MREFLIWLLSRPRVARVLDDILLLRVLYLRGAVSDLACSMHDSIPMRDEEEQAMWSGDDDAVTDPCMFVVRVWAAD